MAFNQRKKRKGGEYLAAIDVGTNSFHMVLVRLDESGKYKVVDRLKEMVRLGSGSRDMKVLSRQAMNRGIATLRRFKKVADAYHAPIRAVATSAVREALNQNEFIRLVYTKTKIKVEVASGFEEARLIYLGVIQALPVFNKRILLIDIGGGSTEFVVGFKRRLRYDNSIKIGAIRLTQGFFKSGTLRNKAVKKCREYVLGTIQPVVREVRKHRFDVVVGSSGTILNLAKMVLLRRGENSVGSLNNRTFTRKELFAIIEKLIDAETVDQRSKIAGLDPGRADIIVGGSIILEQVFRALRLQTLVTSEYALREGIILDTIEKNYEKRAFHDLSNIRYRNVLQIAENYKYEKKHSHHVADLAVQLFDETKFIHRLGVMEREYLEAASLLHEIGLHVSHSQHHRHTYYLVKNTELLGYTENEREIIANVARYHRKSHPKEKHEGFLRLNADDQQLVRRLAALLRIADGLDRSHSHSVREIKVRHTGKNLRLVLNTFRGKNVDLELWGAERKKALFEETFGVKLSFVRSRRS